MKSCDMIPIPPSSYTDVDEGKRSSMIDNLSVEEDASRDKQSDYVDIDEKKLLAASGGAAISWKQQTAAVSFGTVLGFTANMLGSIKMEEKCLAKRRKSK